MDFLKGLLYEGDSPCIPHILALVGYVAFLVGSGWLLYHSAQWIHYETFAGLTAGGGTASVVTNKFINSKYNSAQGQMPNGSQQ